MKEDTIRQKISGLADLSQQEKIILTQFSKEAFGLEKTTAALMLNSSTGIPEIACVKHISDLWYKGYIEVDEGGRYFIAHQKLQIMPEELELAQHLDPFLDRLGAPHESQVMSTLKEMFEDEKGTLYIGIKITDPEIFSALVGRCHRSRHTVVFMPQKRHLPASSHRHYDEVLTKWTELINGNLAVRSYLTLLQTSNAYPELYTSAFAESYVRINSYGLGSKSTRQGTIYVASKDSSIYKLYNERLNLALADAKPLFVIAPSDWLRVTLGRGKVLFLIGLVLLSCIFGFVTKLDPAGNWFVVLIAGVLAGLLVEHLYEVISELLWKPKSIF
jgi:hypothetical protein